jgi:hypothetical protein
MYEGSITQTYIRENTPYSSLDMALGIKTDASGNIFVTGMMSNDGANFRIVTIKYDEDLNWVWADTFAGDGLYNAARGIDIDGDGNIYVIGFKNDSYHPGRDGVILKYTNSGYKIRAQYIQMKDTAGQTELIAIDHDLNNNLFVTGTHKNDATWNQFTVKYDTSGSPLWDKELEVDSGVQAIATDIKVNNDSTIYGLMVYQSVSAKYYGLIAYKNWDYIDSTATSIDTPSYPYIKNEVIVHFKPGIIKSSICASTDMEHGLLNDFLNGGALSIMEAKCGFSLAESRLIKVFKNFTTADSLTLTANNDTIPFPPVYLIMLMTVPSNQNLQQVCDSLIKLDSLVVDAGINRCIVPNTGANDPKYSTYQAGLHLVTGVSENSNINVELAWNSTGCDTSVRIGVLDWYGVDYANADFHLKSGDNTYSGSKVRGYDYANNHDFSTYKDNSYSYAGHATWCAGIIGAIRNNNSVVAGIAGGNASLTNYGSQIGCQLVSMSSPGLIQANAAIADGIYWNPVSKHKGLKVNIFSASFGGNGLSYDDLKMIGLANKAGIIFVASRGNSGKNDENDPATIQYDDLVISVGACEVDGEIKHGAGIPYTGMLKNMTDDVSLNGYPSSWGSKMDVIAPGTSNLVYTVDPINSSGTTFTNTSAACPHVAAVAGLMLSISNYNHIVHGIDKIDPEDVQNIIKNTAEDRGLTASFYNYGPALPGYDDYSGWGLINAGRAVVETLYPTYEIMHYTATGSVNSSKTFVSSFSNCRLSENFKTPSTTIQAGTYSVDMYKVTLPTAYSIPSGYKLVPVSHSGQQSIWGRGSGKNTNVLGDNAWNNTIGTLIYLHPEINYDHVQSNPTTIEGYIYKITSGSFNGTWIPFDPANTNASMEYTVHVCQVTSVVKVPETEVLTKAYPVPSHDVVSLVYTLPSSGTTSLEITDISGRTIASLIKDKFETAGDHRINYSSANLAPGVYIFRLNVNNQQVYEKFIKTN